MVIEISIEQDLERLTRHLSDLERKQLPFATAKALTKTAWDVRNHLAERLPRWLDRPTPFTKRAFRVKRATKTKQVASVYVQEIQERYLRYQIEGGTRTPKGAGIPVPTHNLRLNRYGNMPRRGGTRKLSAAERKKAFIGRAGRSGDLGIWLRTGGKKRPGLKMLVAFKPSVAYRTRRIPFRRAGQIVADRQFGPRFDAAMKDAVRSAK